MIKALCLIAFASVSNGNIHVNPEQVAYVYRSESKFGFGDGAASHTVIMMNVGRFPDTTLRIDEPLDQVVEKLQKGCE